MSCPILKVIEDEYRLSIHPVILGEVKPLFIDIKRRLGLKLINIKKFSSALLSP